MFLGYAVLQILLIKCIIYLMLFPMLNSMFFQISTFRITCSVPSVIIFCSSLTLCFQVCCSDLLCITFEMVPLALLLLVQFFFLHSTTLYCYCKVFILQNHFGFCLDHTYISWNCNVYYVTCCLFVITDYDIQFIVRDGCQFSFVDSIIYIS